MPTAPATSLAFLQVNYDRGQDFIDLFVPVVAYAAFLAGGEYVATEDVQSVLKREFHLVVPQHTLRTIAKRAARDGLFKQENRALRVNRESVEGLDLQSKRSQTERKHQVLVSKLRQYVSAEFGIHWSAEEADAALMDFLEDFDVPVLVAMQNGVELSSVGKSPANSRFLVSSFLRNLGETDLNTLAFFEAIARGNILANVVFFPDIAKVDARFRKTRIYLDSKVVLRALGYEGRAFQAPTRELLDLIIRLGGSIHCFHHTAVEVKDVLVACAKALVGGGIRHAYGPVVEHFSSIGFSASDIRLRAERLKADLSTLRIAMDDVPAVLTRHRLDEKQLDALLQREVRYSKEFARERDLRSLFGTYYHRKDHQPRTLEETPAIFVTANDQVVQVAQQFFSVLPGHRDLAPVCVADHALTDYVWLKQPFSAPDLPRMKIIAECAAALAPEDRLWRRYLEKANQLLHRGDISPDDFYLLRSAGAQDRLVHLTQNQPDAFTEGTVAEVLGRVKSAMTAAAEEQAETASRDAAAARAQIEAWESNRVTQMDRARTIGAWVGRLVRVTILVSVLILLAIGIVSTLPSGLPPITLEKYRYAIAVLQGGLVIATLGNLLWGTTINGLLRRVELNVARRIEALLVTRVLGESVPGLPPR
jgi:hypothetical protein